MKYEENIGCKFSHFLHEKLKVWGKKLKRARQACPFIRKFRVDFLA